MNRSQNGHSAFNLATIWAPILMQRALLTYHGEEAVEIETLIRETSEIF
jgi:hypothetical protein